MPLFEFTCKKCKKDFEELFCSYDTAKVVCVNCGSSKVVKKMSAFGVKAVGNCRPAGHNCDGCCSSREACSKSSFS